MDTIVSKDKQGRYVVRKKTGLTPDGNGNFIPIYDETIGYIENGAYAELTKERKRREETENVRYLHYGSFAFADSVCYPLRRELSNLGLGIWDGDWNYCVFLLRAIYGDIKDDSLFRKYEQSYCSICYPKISYAKIWLKYSVQSETDIGKNHPTVLEKSFDLRKKEGHPFLVFAMVKKNTKFTQTWKLNVKERKRPLRDVVNVYVIDTITKEPVFFKTYLQDSITKECYLDFFQEYPLEKGYLLLDDDVSFADVEGKISKDVCLIGKKGQEYEVSDKDAMDKKFFLSLMKLKEESMYAFSLYTSVLSESKEGEDEKNAYGSELFDFYSSLLRIRLIHRLEEKKKELKMEPSQVMDVLDGILVFSLNNGKTWKYGTRSKTEEQVLKILDL